MRPEGLALVRKNDCSRHRRLSAECRPTGESASGVRRQALRRASRCEGPRRSVPPKRIFSASCAARIASCWGSFERPLHRLVQARRRVGRLSHRTATVASSLVPPGVAQRRLLGLPARPAWPRTEPPALSLSRLAHPLLSPSCAAPSGTQPASTRRRSDLRPRLDSRLGNLAPVGTARRQHGGEGARQRRRENREVGARCGQCAACLPVRAATTGTPSGPI